jgi:hypothetical protein
MSSWPDNVDVAAPRLMLDTNVWAYIVENDGVETLRGVARGKGVDVVACPAVVYELLRVPDPLVRKKRAKAIAKEAWVRLMPEAFSESEDVRAELYRLRPSWFRASPDLRLFHKNRADWQGAFWWRVRRSPDAVARHIGVLGNARLEQARAESKTIREETRRAGHTIDTFRWNSAEAVFAGPTPGWDGKPFEAWRSQSVARWWEDLVLGRSATVQDWLTPWIDVPAIRSDQSSWTRFWTREIEVAAVPREWIRWAMAQVQATRTWSNGTPGDNQISTYLLDVDLAISTDKVFVDLAGRMRAHSPAPLAEVHRAPAGSGTLDAVVTLIHEVA